MKVKATRIGPEFETRPQGRCIVYEVVLYRDGEEVDRQEEAELLHMLPDDPDEAASVMEARVSRRTRNLLQRFAEGRGQNQKERALRIRLDGA